MLFFSRAVRSVDSWILKFATLSIFLLLSGCVKPTKFPSYLTVADVVNNVKCQLYQAILDNAGGQPNLKSLQFSNANHWIYGWTAQFEIYLQVLREGSIDGDTSTVIPYTLGTFTIGASAGLRRNSKARISFDFYADDNLSIFMRKDQCAHDREFRRRRNLAGETGLRLWFSKLIGGMGGAGIRPNGFTYSVTFLLAANGSILPSYRFAWPSRRVLSGKITGKKSREDENQLKVTFAPAKADPPSFEETALGIMLQGIRDDLAALNKDKDDATIQADQSQKDFQAAEKKAEEEKAAEFAKFGKPPSQERLDAIEAPVKRTRRIRDEDVRRKEAIERAIESKRRRENILIQQRRLIAVPRPGISATTRSELNSQLLRDTLRDIER